MTVTTGDWDFDAIDETTFAADQTSEENEGQELVCPGRGMEVEPLEDLIQRLPVAFYNSVMKPIEKKKPSTRQMKGVKKVMETRTQHLHKLSKGRGKLLRERSQALQRAESQNSSTEAASASTLPPSSSPPHLYSSSFMGATNKGASYSVVSIPVCGKNPFVDNESFNKASIPKSLSAEKSQIADQFDVFNDYLAFKKSSSTTLNYGFGGNFGVPPAQKKAVFGTDDFPSLGASSENNMKTEDDKTKFDTKSEQCSSDTSKQCSFAEVTKLPQNTQNVVVIERLAPLFKPNELRELLESYGEVVEFGVWQEDGGYSAFARMATQEQCEWVASCLNDSALDPDSVEMVKCYIPQ